MKRLLLWLLVAGALAFLAWSVLPVLAAPVDGDRALNARRASTGWRRPRIGSCSA